jgi:hypothetical protein
MSCILAIDHCIELTDNLGTQACFHACPRQRRDTFAAEAVSSKSEAIAGRRTRRECRC